MPDGKKLTHLESVRGLAAVVVVLSHLMLAFRPDLADPFAASVGGASWPVRILARSPLAFCWNGALAVNVFFVLSGFVLSYSFFGTGRHDSIAGPAIRRYFRLSIPSGVSIVAAYLLMRGHLICNAGAGRLTGSHWLLRWFQITPRLFAFDPDGAVYQAVYGIFRGQSFEYNNVLWTMQVELLGSFMVYATLAVFGSVGHRAVIYTVLGVLLVVTEQHNYLGFVIGMAGCDRLARAGRPVDIGRAGWAVLGTGLTVGAYCGASSENLPAVAAGALVVAAPLLSESVRATLESAVLGFLGRISFGLYLTHVLVIASLGSGIVLHLVRVDHWAVHAAAAVAAFAVIGVSLITGWVMFFIADRPSIAVGRRVSDWFTAEPDGRVPRVRTGQKTARLLPASAVWRGQP
jgi:peptidoglycan/LPS O-acetylase OafA/YrhL